VTDGRTDRRIDRIAVSIAASNTVDARQKRLSRHEVGSKQFGKRIDEQRGVIAVHNLSSVDVNYGRHCSVSVALVTN